MTPATVHELFPDQASDVRLPDKGFGAWRGKWHDQVFYDRDLVGDCLRIAYAITTYLRPGHRECFPGEMSLAERADRTERQVRNCLHELRDRGHLEIEKSKRGFLILRPILKAKGE